LVEIGLARRTQPFELEDAITDRTAAVAHLISPFTSPPGTLPLDQVIAVAHRRGVPVIVDAASMLPPRENLTKFLRLGADLVSFSGGKGIRGPQSTGILAGRRDLVRAVTLNASPNQALGRAAKTSKEEIAGLVTALELFIAEDEASEMKRYTDVCQTIVDGLADIHGLRVVVEQDPVNRVLPHAVVYFGPDWRGPARPPGQGAPPPGGPPFYLQQGGAPGGPLRRMRPAPVKHTPRGGHARGRAPPAVGRGRTRSAERRWDGHLCLSLWRPRAPSFGIDVRFAPPGPGESSPALASRRPRQSGSRSGQAHSRPRLAG